MAVNLSSIPWMIGCEVGCKISSLVGRVTKADNQKVGEGREPYRLPRFVEALITGAFTMLMNLFVTPVLIYNSFPGRVIKGT